MRFQRSQGLPDTALANAIRDAERGLIDADLGAGLIKQRVARPGQGKRGGYRTVIAYRARIRSVFLYGFAKSAKAALQPDELKELAEIGASWLAAGDYEIEVAIADERLTEVDYGTENES